MSRRHAAEKRIVYPDVKYNNVIVAKFVNSLMKGGKKSVAEHAFYGALDMLKSKYKESDPLECFIEALDNVKPSVEVRSRRIGGATYQVPSPVREDRSIALAIRWLISFARKRSEKTIKDSLAAEIFDAKNKRGGAIKKSEETFKMAESNKAFAHYKL